MKYANKLEKHYYDNLKERSIYLRELFDSFLIQRRFESYLDIGCGLGTNTSAFAGLSRRTIGLERRESDVLKARKTTTGISFKVGDAHRLPFRQKFDLITAFSMIEHAKNPKKILSETKSILAKNGILVLQIPNKFFFVELHTYLPLTFMLPKKIRWWLLSRLGYEYTDIRPTDMSIRYLVSILQEQGFVCQVKPMTYPEHLVPIPKALYRIMHGLGLFKLFPFGYFMVCRQNI